MFLWEQANSESVWMTLHSNMMHAYCVSEVNCAAPGRAGDRKMQSEGQVGAYLTDSVHFLLFLLSFFSKRK